MACRYTYKGKTYEAHEFDDVLKAMPPAEASKFIAGVKAIPSAPMISDTKAWVALAIKRMTAYAVENNFDKVAFISGQQAADLYDLSKQVDRIEYFKRDDGSYMVEAFKDFRSNNPVWGQGRMTIAEIEAALGKDVAEKIESRASLEVQTLSGLDLKIGGEGMRAFYDQIVPQVAKKLVGTVDAIRFSGAETDTIVRDDPSSEFSSFSKQVTGRKPDMVQLAFTITPQMREKVSGGMPLFSRAQPSSFNAPEPSKLDSLIYALQDKHVDLKRVQEAIAEQSGAIKDDTNAYMQEELFHGRTAKRVQNFVHDELEPLIEDMRTRGVKMADFEEYLWARHAEERNIQIARINPDMPDGGSGMMTQDARDYLSSLTSKQKQDYEALASRIDAMTSKSRQVLVDYGLESQDTIDTWGKAYGQYVPLMREDMDHGHGLGTGQGYSVKGNASKRATGSGRPVVDIIANIAQQRERNIIRGEKNRVAMALIGLAEQNENKEFWKVDSPPKTKTVQDGKTVYRVTYHGTVVEEFASQHAADKFIEWNTKADEPDAYAVVKEVQPDRVVEMVDPNYKNRDNVVVARYLQNGKIVERSVTFNERDPRAMRMALSIKNLDQDQLGEVLSASAKVTRYFASVNTQYNPVFGVINLLRDAQGAMLNLSSTPLQGKQAEVSKNIWSALTGIYSDIRRHRAGQQPNSSWSKLWAEFQYEGGQTGYRDMFRNARERAEAIEESLNPDWWMEGKVGKILTANGYLAAPEKVMADKVVRPLFGLISDYNEAMENAVRLAAYKSALDSGMSKQQAASLAKNLTVNFNRKGEAGRQIGALYAFFNASVQGTARIVETLNGKAGKRIIQGGLLLGFIQAVMLAGFDDDEPPQWERDRNIIIPNPTGDGTYIKIAMPLGFNALPAFGRIMTEWAMDGFQDPGKRMVHVLDMLLDVTNPIGNAGLSLQTIAPTAIDPLAALAENKDFTGRPIAREDFNSLDPTPGHTRGKDTAWIGSKILSEGINWMTGGTDYKPGAVSPTPDQIDYLIGQLTGGVGREVMKAEQTVTSTVTGDNLPIYKIPLIGRFAGNAKGQAQQGAAFYENLRTIHMHENEIQGRRKEGVDASEYVAENPESRLIFHAKRAESMVKKLRQQRKLLIQQGAQREQIAFMDEQITRVMAGLNDAVLKVKQQ